MKKVVTVDYDGTLTKPEVFSYVKHLLTKTDMEVWILTFRYDDLQAHNYPSNPHNNDLWHTVDSLGLPRHKVRFTNMEPKSNYLQNTRSIWHLDDDLCVIEDVECYSPSVIPIHVNSSDWMERCEVLLK